MRINSVVLMLGGLLSATRALAQEPVILHAQLSTQLASRSLAEQMKSIVALTWIGYPIAVAAGFHSGENGSRVSFLEGGEGSDNHSAYNDATFDHLLVLMRVSGGSVEKLRIENPDRQLDAGGLPFVWLTGVTPEESLHLLRTIAIGSGPEKLRNDAVFLVSLHQSSEATPTLVQLASTGGDTEVREKAAFWLANQRGHEGFEAIRKLAHEDPDAHFREKVTFDLTLCHDPEALEELIRMAKNDTSPQVRRQAQFWMANIGGKKVTGDLRESAERDPDAEVRKSAVFALSRLPGDEAATQLIQVVRTSGDPAVRKQAVFWLGQSSDPHALDYLAQLLHP